MRGGFQFGAVLLDATHDFEGGLSCFLRWNELGDAPRRHLAVRCWVYCNALARGIVPRCQPVVRAAPVNK